MKKIDSESLKIYFSKNSYRYKHIVGVVDEMNQLLEHFDLEEHIKEELIQLAYIHDIGHSEKLVKTGFHPLDGGLFCKKEKYSKDIIAAVMFHSGAYEDVRRNFPDLEYAYLEYKYYLTKKAKLYIELITYCDLHRSLTGKSITFREKLQEVFAIYGEDHNRSLTLKSKKTAFLQLINRVEAYKRSCKLPSFD